MSSLVEKAVVKYVDELKEYNCTKKFPGVAVLNFNRVGKTEYYIGTFTAYNEEGLKSDKALPFKTFIAIVNEMESLLKKYQDYGFTGIIAGWNPTQYIKSFLYNKKVHRLFFLHETDIMSFIGEYTEPKRVEDREAEVVVTFG